MLTIVEKIKVLFKLNRGQCLKNGVTMTDH